MSSLDYLDLCRLCLVKDRVSVPIFEGEGDVRQIFLKIAACLPVKVGREDKLPKKICDDCVYKVELFYQFWNTTANAEKQLLQWLGDVSLDDKQGYVTGPHPSLMKPGQNPGENRLDGSVMQQVNDHPNNMGMGMLDSMGMGMPMMISTSGQQQQPQQQMTSVPMDTGGGVQTVQAVPGPSTQSSHDQIPQQKASENQEDDEDESEEDENSDDECDGDDGLPVKEESEEDPNSSRNIEPTTFVNVSLACDEAGPSGLQQQKIGEMPEMVMPPTDGDPKSGSWRKFNDLVLRNDDYKRQHYGKIIVPVGTWQRVDFNGEIDNTIDPLLQSELKIQVIEEMSKLKEKRLCGNADDWHNCEKCGLKFPLETMLNRHMVAHNYSIGLKKIKKSVSPSSKPGNLNKTKNNHDESSPEVRYNCTICDFTCNKRSTFMTHLKSEHDHRNFLTLIKSKQKPSQIYYCKICNFESKKQANLMSHVRRNHGQELEVQVILDDEVELKNKQVDPMRNSKARKKLIVECLKCEICDFECTNKSTLYSHKRRHRAIDTGVVYQCDECNYKTAKKQSLYSHIHRKHKPCESSGSRSETEFFSCSQCDYKNKNKYELKVHVARKHTDDFKFSCDICGKNFKVKGDLTNHIRFTHREQPVICDVCGKTCLNSNSLYVHQKFAHYKPKYECQVCKRRMVSQENLDEHMLRQHEKRENVVCEECGKTFSRNSRLKIHMRIHTGDKPYDCTICNKSFARRTALKQHLLIHTGMRPYVCDICGKAFTQKPGLISHRKSHPGPLPPLPRVLIDPILNDVLRPPL